MPQDSGPIFWSDEQYEIRPAKNTDEFRDVWWGFMQTLGWNRGYYDLNTYMNPSIGHGMILLAEKATGKSVGHVAAVINANSTGWVSMFIIDEKHRGKGLGAQLFKAAEADLQRMGTRYIGLDGVVEQKQTYQRRHFVASSLGTIRIMIRDLDAKQPVPKPRTARHIIDIRKVPLKLLVQHEQKYTGFERPDLWSNEHIFNRKDVHGVAVVDKAEPRELDDLRAWAVLRRCSGGIRIGPLYASDSECAKAALLAAMKMATPSAIKEISLPNEAMNNWSEQEIAEKATLVTEVWGGNMRAVQLFEDVGWKYAGVEYYRMWIDGVAPPEQSRDGLSQQGVFAIFDAAVG